MTRSLGPTSTTRPGFGLLEVLVSIAVISILLALLIPAIQAARQSARRAHCTNNLRQIGVAVHNYESQHRHLPAGKDDRERGWHLALLPFIDQTSLSDASKAAFDMDPSPYTPFHPSDITVGTYVCPEDSRIAHANWNSSSGRPTAHTSYIGVSGIDFETNNGVLSYRTVTRLGQVTDGTSNTLLAGERPPSPDFNFGWWYTGAGQDGTGNAEMFMGIRERISPHSAVRTYSPACDRVEPYEYGPGSLDEYCDMMHFWSQHTGGATFVFADGSVRMISYGVSGNVLTAIATKNGGETSRLP